MTYCYTSYQYDSFLFMNIIRLNNVVLKYIHKPGIKLPINASILIFIRYIWFGSV